MAIDRVLHGIGHAAAMAREEHKILCENLYRNLYNEFSDEWDIHIEWCIDKNNLESKAPDIVLFGEDKDTAILIVEITTTRDFKNACKKVMELAVEYDVQEYFVYDYEAEEWSSNNKQRSDYSELLDCYLDKLLYP